MLYVRILCMLVGAVVVGIPLGISISFFSRYIRYPPFIRGF